MRTPLVFLGKFYKRQPATPSMIENDGNGDEKDLGQDTLEEYDRILEEAEEEGTVPEDATNEEMNYWMSEQLETAADNVLLSEEIAEEEARFDDMEMAEAQGWNEEDGGSSDDGFDPDEENWEAEDMPGDNADEREEAYDNHDWDAADG